MSRFRRVLTIVRRLQRVNDLVRVIDVGIGIGIVWLDLASFIWLTMIQPEGLPVDGLIKCVAPSVGKQRGRRWWWKRALLRPSERVGWE